MPEITTDDLRQFVTASTETVELPAATEEDLSDLSTASVSEDQVSQIDRDVMIVIDNLVTGWLDLNPEPTEQQVQQMIDSLGASSTYLRDLISHEVRTRIGVVQSVDPACPMETPSETHS